MDLSTGFLNSCPLFSVSFKSSMISSAISWSDLLVKSERRPAGCRISVSSIPQKWLTSWVSLFIAAFNQLTRPINEERQLDIGTKSAELGTEIFEKELEEETTLGRDEMRRSQQNMISVCCLIQSPERRYTNPAPSRFPCTSLTLFRARETRATEVDFVARVYGEETSCLMSL